MIMEPQSLFLVRPLGKILISLDYSPPDTNFKTIHHKKLCLWQNTKSRCNVRVGLPTSLLFSPQRRQTKLAILSYKYTTWTKFKVNPSVRYAWHPPEILLKHFARWARTLSHYLTLKADVQPKFWKSLLLPFSIKPTVEQDLESLNGVLQRVDYSQWAISIVVVPKPSKADRIYGDFSVTVNP